MLSNDFCLVLSFNFRTISWFGFISKIGLISGISICPIERIISCICAVGSFSSATMHDGESFNREDIFTSFTLSPNNFFIFFKTGFKDFSSSFFLSLSSLKSSDAPLLFTDFSSLSSYLGTPVIMISSISSSKIRTSISFFSYISKRGEFLRLI